MGWFVQAVRDAGCNRPATGLSTVVRQLSACLWCACMQTAHVARTVCSLARVQSLTHATNPGAAGTGLALLALPAWAFCSGAACCKPGHPACSSVYLCARSMWLVVALQQASLAECKHEPCHAQRVPSCCKEQGLVTTTYLAAFLLCPRPDAHYAASLPCVGVPSVLCACVVSTWGIDGVL